MPEDLKRRIAALLEAYRTTCGDPGDDLVDEIITEVDHCLAELSKIPPEEVK